MRQFKAVVAATPDSVKLKKESYQAMLACGTPDAVAGYQQAKKAAARAVLGTPRSPPRRAGGSVWADDLVDPAKVTAESHLQLFRECFVLLVTCSYCRADYVVGKPTKSCKNMAMIFAVTNMRFVIVFALLSGVFAAPFMKEKEAKGFIRLKRQSGYWDPHHSQNQWGFTIQEQVNEYWTALRTDAQYYVDMGNLMFDRSVATENKIN
ncbi:hypothetical protein L3Q82_020540 [Scortum barcoo]|uniref:Uncharacterized protein n=1 Tax=Scortum barcoo TaxID=214431 RepID=A0ACB8V849_9TELE|nr:hypothetical protein L3Q82_020540 [Scortum barcoo]